MLENTVYVTTKIKERSDNRTPEIFLRGIYHFQNPVLFQILVGSSKSIAREHFSNVSIKSDSGHAMAFSFAKRTACAKNTN